VRRPAPPVTPTPAPAPEVKPERGERAGGILPPPMPKPTT
jgi:hypothetical protein